MVIWFGYLSPSNLTLKHDDPRCWKWGLLRRIWVMRTDPSWMAWCPPHGHEWVSSSISFHKNWMLKKEPRHFLFLQLPLSQGETPAPASPSIPTISFTRPRQRWMLALSFLNSLQNPEPKQTSFLCKFPSLGHSFTATRNSLTHKEFGGITNSMSLTQIGLRRF